MTHDPTARSISAGDLEAMFLPDRGMLCASLRHKGEELLRRIEDLDTAAAKGSTAGIPFLYPWANRLAELRYSIDGREVILDPSSSLLHFDEHGLPMHGVSWALLVWNVVETKSNFISAMLSWDRTDLLAIFPFRHRIEMMVTMEGNGLTLKTTIRAASQDVVPVSFGFHPYFGIPGIPREDWAIQLPAMQKLKLDKSGIPNGEVEAFDGFNSKLNQLSFDDGFAVIAENPSFSLSGAGHRILLEWISGYRFAQIYAPKGKDYIAFEPMTAPTNALVSGQGLQFVHPGESFTAEFRIRIE